MPTLMTTDVMRQQLARVAAEFESAHVELLSYSEYLQIGETIRLYFERSNKIRDKGRHLITCKVWNGKEWNNGYPKGFETQIKLTKSPTAISDDLRRRILPDIEKIVVRHTDARERMESEHALATITLQNCLNASRSHSTSTLKTPETYAPTLEGTIHDAEYRAECPWRKPDRVDLTLKNLSSYAAQQIMAVIFTHQDK